MHKFRLLHRGNATTTITAFAVLFTLLPLTANATEGEYTAARLSREHTPEDRNGELAGKIEYQVQYRLTASEGWQLISRQRSNVATYKLSELEGAKKGTSICFRVVASHDDRLESEPSDEYCALIDSSKMVSFSKQ